MKELTEKQKKLITLMADKAKVDPELAIEWVEDGKCTISELSLGILGVSL